MTIVAAGDVIVREIRHGELVRYKIEHADPIIRISAQLLADINERFATVDGDVLTMRGCNRTLVYVIDRESFDGHSYRAQWPD